MNSHVTRRAAERVLVIAACSLALIAYAPAGVSAQSNPGTHPNSRSIAADHLKEIHGAAKKYGAHNNGSWPGLDKHAGALMFPMKGVYPDYLTDPRILVNPANEKAVARVKGLPVNEANLSAYWYNGSYWYLGYAITTEMTGLAFVDAYKKALEQGRVPTGDLKVPMGEGDGGGDTIYQLREGVGRFFVQNINHPSATAVSESEIPVMITRPVDGGGNVLYMDGHVEYLKYPGKFPMTPAFISALKSLDHLLPPRDNPTNAAS